MTICAMLYNSTHSELLRARLQSSSKDREFEWCESSVLDAAEQVGLTRVAAAFGVSASLVAHPTGAAKSELYNADAFDVGLNGVRYLQLVMDELIRSRTELGLSKLGLLFFQDWDDTNSVRFLSGAPNQLTSFAEMNHGLASARFLLTTGHVQMDVYDPLLFQAMF